MAGSNSAFDPALFRTKIKQAMAMGAPTSVADRATFRWKAIKTYTSEDPANHPYSWNAVPTTSTQHADVQVDVAIQLLGGDPQEFTSVGELNAQKVELTVLDVDYALVEGANYVLLGQKTYIIDYVAPPIGLFDVTVYQLFLTAEDT